jgi:hypothetical protein
MKIEEANIFATGCSFTWGESLQFFSGLDSVVWKPIRQAFPDTEKTLDEAQLDFIKKNRWPAQLADKLGVNHITQARNGGSNNQSLLKAQYFYNNSENLKNYKNFIIQITEFSRDPIIFNLPNGESIHITDASIIHAEKDILGLDDEKIMQDSYTSFYDRLYEFTSKLKSEHNVETYIIVYPRDAVTSLQDHKLYKNFVPLLHNGIEYDSTDNLGRKNSNLIISNYFASQNLNKGDNHLTLDGHKIISNSIYNRIIETIK